VADWYWHIHHETICEPLTEPLQNRLDYIRDNKPSGEVETRLRLIAPVTIALPPELDKAREAYVKAWEASVKAAREASVKAWEAYVKAWEASVKAGAAYDKARVDAAPELERLHAIDCPAALAGTCPWDGNTIFPGGPR
jgi:hypothetical protein